jgi:hypothetical protein
MRKFKITSGFLFVWLLLIIIFRPGTVKLISDLNPKNPTTTKAEAAYELGERKEISAVKPLLTNILDPGTSTNLNFKGMTVCYCRLMALKKISGLEPLSKIDQFSVDTLAAEFYLNWAVKEKYIKSKNEIDLNCYR